MTDRLTTLDGDERGYWERVHRSKRPHQWGSLAWVDLYYPYRRYDQELRRYVHGRGYRTFLDLGCGPGNWLVHAARRLELEPVGIDYSEPGCALARENLRRGNVQGHVVCGDFTDAQPLVPPCDVVYLGGVIEHYEDPVSLLRHVMRYLKPGGTLVNRLPTSMGTNAWFRRVTGTGRPHLPVSVERISSWYAELGLGDIRACYSGSLCLSRFPMEDILPRPRWLNRVAVRWPVRAIDAAVSGTLIALTSCGAPVPEGPIVSPHVIALGRKSQ